MSAGSAAAQAGAGAGAGEGTQLEEVVVTATRTGETALQRTPIAISAYSGEKLATRGIDNLRDLVTLSPNIELSDLAGQASLFIRGIGTNNGGYVGSDPSSTLQIDGVYISRALAYTQDFLDVERVEVLRGPQGTLYGRNAVGGTINIISREPSATPTGELQVSGGTYGRFGVNSYVSGPISDSGLRGSLAYLHLQHDPYFKNVSSGGGVDDDDSDAIRGQLLAPLGASADLTLRADYAQRLWRVPVFPKLLQPDGVALDDSILGDFSRVSINGRSKASERDGGVSAELNAQLPDGLRFKSLTALRADRGRLSFDADSSSMPILHTVSPDSLESQFSQEFNLSAKTSRINWVTGLYYYLENFRDPLLVTIYPASVSNIRQARLNDQAIAAYGQAEYFATDKLSFVAGVRYTSERKHLVAGLSYTASTSLNFAEASQAPVIGAPFFPPPFAVDASRTDGAWTPKFGVNYHTSKDVLVYATVTRGFKSGGYAIGSPDAADLAAGYAPEYLWAYELGLKADWLARRLRTNLTGFYYDFSNLQVTTEKPPIGEVTTNAGAAKLQGIEAELQARPVAPLSIYANLSYLDAYYTRYPDAYVTQFGVFDAAGATLNNAPRWAIATGGSYEHSLGERGALTLSVDYRWQSRVFFTPANGGVGGVTDYAEQQRAYGLLNATIGWHSSDRLYSVELIGRNLTQTHYVVATASYTAAISGLPGDPRTLLVQLSRRW